MANSITQFNRSLDGIVDLTSTIQQMDRLTTNIIDISDLYRSQIVLVVSSLDHFIHEFVLEEMIETYNGRRLPTLAFSKFPIPVSSVLTRRPTDSIIGSHIRQKHSWLSFQDPDKIADALKLISDKRVWEEVSPAFGLRAQDIKTKLKIIVDRRNKIAHESDLDPSFPGHKWPISLADVEDTTEFIKALGNEIFAVVK